MFFKSKLQKLIERWLKNGGDLDEILRGLKTRVIKTEKEAKAVSLVLQKLSLKEHSKESHVKNPLHSIVAMFQEVQSRAACQGLIKSGLPELRRLLQEGLESPQKKEYDLLMILKILGMYRQEEDAHRIVQVARDGVDSKSFWWSVVFRTFDKAHPYWKIVADGLREPLPRDFIGVTYLDFVNKHAIENELQDHPFNTKEGIARLRDWLEDENQEHFSYAHSAAAALPFLNPQVGEELLALACKHPDYNVRIESAWAMAKIGDRKGVENLKQFALDARFSQTACQYLSELGVEQEIPEEALEEDFRAMAQMSNWLSHPNEFGRFPDDIVLYDTRRLYWPPTNDERKVWLFKYTYEPVEKDGQKDIGISMVGSVTFALFGEATSDLSPEEVYGLHCAWELDCNKDRRAPDKRSPQSGLKILRECNRNL